MARIRIDEDDELFEALNGKRKNKNENLLDTLRREAPEIEEKLIGEKDKDKGLSSLI